MFKGLFGRKNEKKESGKKGEVLAVQNGRAVGIEEVPDDVFARKILGDGVAVIPEDGKVYSPVNGMVVSTVLSGHAYGIQADEGAEILVHIGVDTVALKGEGFKSYVKEGQRVKAGDLLAEVDLELVKKKGYHTITPVLLTNMDEVRNVKMVLGEVKAGKTLMISYEKQYADK